MVLVVVFLVEVVLVEVGKMFEKIKSVLGDNLVSIIKYDVGFVERFLFVLKDIDILVLDKVKPFFQPVFLFLTKESVVNGVDVFPLEFFNIKTDHEVVFGEDVFKGLEFDKEHIRRQLEFEFRSKLIHLRQEYLSLKGKGLRSVIFAAVPVLTPLLKGMAFLKNISVSEDGLIDKVSHAFDEDLSVLKDIELLKQKNSRMVDEDLLVQRLMLLLKNLGAKLDKLS